MHKRILLTLAIALVGSLAASAAAQAAAGTVSVYNPGSFKQIYYNGTAGVDEVTFGGSHAEHTVTIAQAGIADPGPTADPLNICALTAPDTLTCTDPQLGIQRRQAGIATMGASADVTTGTGTQYWKVDGGAGEDHLTGSDKGEDYLEGGPDNDILEPRGTSNEQYPVNRADGDQGNDVLRGGPSDDALYGNEGNDDLEGREGRDDLEGGEGFDTLRAGPGDDYLDPGPGDGEVADGGDGSDWFDCIGDPDETYDGGAGFDTVECYGGVDIGDYWEPHDYAIDLSAGTVRRTNHIPTTSSIRSLEDAETYDGNDVLIGTDGANSLLSGRGNDSIDGRGGSDIIYADIGTDTIQTGDGAADRADGGPDADTCHGDQIDDLFGCEALTLAPLASGGSPDQTAPQCKVIRARGNHAKGTIDVRATCDQAATLGAEAIGRLKRPTRGALASRVGDVTLGTAAGRAAANASARVVVRVSKRYRRALRKGARIRVVLHSTDAVGNAGEVTRTVRMR